MTHAHLTPVEKALASLKRPINDTKDGVVTGEDIANKQPVDGWNQLARTGEHHQRQTISHK